MAEQKHYQLVTQTGNTYDWPPAPHIPQRGSHHLTGREPHPSGYQPGISFHPLVKLGMGKAGTESLYPNSGAPELRGQSFWWVRDLASVDVAKLVVTMGVWLVYLTVLLMRWRAWLVSARFAWVCVVMFFIALLSLGPVNSSRHHEVVLTPER